ncbi:DUF4270 domain-containing protein [Ascidiimonas sp. W6]|uniref:DUF4270 domain-containing protein n=1 Tax=Ascidiimonas meishanensis TaxID=3128903 RepID=UPI0030EF0005
MKLIGKRALRLLPVLMLAGVVFSCDDDFNEIGTNIIGGGNFETDKAVFEAYAYNKEVIASRTDGLPVYQLGRLSNNFYQQASSSIVSQLSLSTQNPLFGRIRQDQEDENAADSDPLTIDENERVTKVYLNLPFFTENSALNDSDGDGLIDRFDTIPDDPDSDSDGDGLTDIEESRNGTDPLNPDTDGDGINDAEDDDTPRDIFPRKFEIDSIYGERETPFTLKVDELTFYLRDLDPSSNFENPQEYFSNMQFSGFLGANLYNDSYVLNPEEILIFNEDDPDTEDVDESLTVEARLSPRIRVELDPQFFQENILDKEGDIELDNNVNFREFLRGLVISTVNTDDLLALFDLGSASVEIQYEYDRVVTQGTSETTDDEIETAEDSFSLSLTGNRVNIFENDPFPVDETEEASQIFLRGGAGNIAEIRLFDNEGTENLEAIRQNNWLINEANLIFYVDREALDAVNGVNEPFRIYLYNLDDNLPLLDYQFDLTQDQNPIRSRTTYGGILEKNDEGDGVRYKIRLTEHINNVVRKDSTNVRLGLSVTSNINVATLSNATVNPNEDIRIPQSSVINPFGTVLFGSAVTEPEDEDKKLKLEIYYTEIEN